MKKFNLALFFLILLSGINTAFGQANPSFSSITGKLIRVTPRLADLDKNPTGLQPQQTRDENGLVGVVKKTGIIHPFYNPTDPGPDKALQMPSSGFVTTASATIGTNIVGLPYTSVNPSDPNCAVGPNHVIQTINNSSSSYFKIWDKSGTQVQAQTLISSLSGVTGNGDPVVVYDQLAGRWLLTEFGKTPSSQTFINTLILAVSTTDDPTGSWYIYSFVDNSFFVDYPKFSIWHNAYYATSNDFNTAGTIYLGSSIYAFDRNKMLNGDPSATAIRTRLTNADGRYYSMAPVCVEGNTPSTQSGLFAYFSDNQFTSDPVDSDSLYIFEFTPNFVTPASSTISANTKILVTNFDSQVCIATRGQCISQQGSAVAVEDLTGRLMHKVIYRNFGTHESIVCNTTVDASGAGRAGIRWWELRHPASVWGLYQEGTYSPDANHRWLGGICMDAIGNIGLMYNASGSTAFPSIRFTGRNPGDALGTMSLPEQTIIAGTVANGSTRYGDYNTLCVDPSNGRDLWLTAQYNAASTWSTRVAAFKIDNSTPAPKIRFDNASLALRETDANIVSGCGKYKDYTVNVVIESAPSANAVVTFSTSGTATNGLDYTITPASVTLTSGTLTQPLTIRLLDDASVEGTESFAITYTINNNGGDAAADSYNQTCNVNIVDNDAGPINASTASNTVGAYNANLSATTPFKGNQSKFRLQSLFTAAELVSSGITTARDFTSMTLRVVTKISAIPFTGFTISMGNTSATNLSAGFVNPTFTTVYSSNYSTVTGNNLFTFATPFAWDGTSNVVINFCYDNASSAASADVAEGNSAPLGSGIRASTYADGIVSSPCTSTATNVSDFRINATFGTSINSTVISTALNSSKTASLGPNEDVYFYDASGNIMARIKNLTSFDYGCTQVVIDRAGSSVVQFWNAVPSNYLTSKSFKVIPTNNTSSGSYQITFYYNTAEVNGFNTDASPSTFATSQIVKVSNGYYIPDVTPASPHFSDIYVVGGTIAAYGTTGNTITATFTNTGFSGFAVGTPGNSLLTADYRSKSSGNYSDGTKWEYNIFGSNYIDANQAPTSGSNVNIQNGHTMLLDASQTIGSSKTLSVNGSLDAGTNTISGAGTFTLAAGATLATSNTGANGISQNITVSGTKTFTDGANYTFNGASTAPFGSHFTTVRPNNLVIGANVTLDKSTYVTGALGFSGSSRTLTTGSNLTIGSSISGTARIADLTKDFFTASAISGNSISGTATVERYIANAGHRSWHLLGAKAVTGSQTIYQSWQENGATGGSLPNYGTWITSNLHNGSNGFDASSNSASILTHNQGGAGGPSFNYNLANTNSTVLSANQGYMLFVRGDRNYTPTLPTPTATNATTLRTNGTVTQGTQAAVVVSATGTGRTLVANPYASPIDFESIQGTTNLNQTFYIWDPTLTGNYGVGGYVLVDRNGGSYQVTPVVLGGTSSSPSSRYIHTGAAFFLKATGADANVIFTESAKTASVSAYNPFVNAPGDQQLIVNLMIVHPGENASLADGLRIRFDNNYKYSISDDEEKMGNFAENISSYREGRKWIIEKRPLIKAGDTIYLRTSGLGIKKYQLQLGTLDFIQPEVKAWLVDRYLGFSKPIDLSGAIQTMDFSVTADPGSSAPDRFIIVFQNDRKITQADPGITVFPSPVTGNRFSVRFNEMEKGSYEMRLFSNSGQLLSVKQLIHPGLSATLQVDIGPATRSGQYRLVFIRPDGMKVERAIVVIR